MASWPEIPQDARDWLVNVFAEANRQVTQRLINVPNIRETSLDDGLIEALVPFSPPRLLPSGSVVEMQIHNIGGLRTISKWETADIAVLVFIYNGTQLSAKKIGLLQSKRLYPENNDVHDDDKVDFAYGMNRFLRRDPTSAFGKIQAQYDFSRESVYGALKAGDRQQREIEKVNDDFGEAVYYLFYNPPAVPASVRYPVVSSQYITAPPLGCRVFSTDTVDAVLAKIQSGSSPTLGDLESVETRSNWRLEEWVDLLLLCKVGQQFDETREQLVGRLLERRSGPIGAAIAVSIALPSD